MQDKIWEFEKCPCIFANFYQMKFSKYFSKQGWQLPEEAKQKYGWEFGQGD